jgi:hypothetical protein
MKKETKESDLEKIQRSNEMVSPYRGIVLEVARMALSIQSIVQSTMTYKKKAQSDRNWIRHQHSFKFT